MGLRPTKCDESSSRSLTVAVRTDSRVFNGVPMALQATKIGEDAGFSRSFSFNGLNRVFNGVPMGLRLTKGNEDAGLPRGDCLRCPKRSAMRFKLLRQWTLRAVPGPTSRGPRLQRSSDGLAGHQKW